eukprot:8823750-Pyramimonas_sp.AAC.1
MRMGCKMRILRAWQRAARDHCPDALPSTKKDIARGPKGPAKAPTGSHRKSSRRGSKGPWLEKLSQGPKGPNYYNPLQPHQPFSQTVLD